MNAEGMLICGTTVQLVGPLAKWPGDNPDLPWHYDLTGYRGGLSAQAIIDAFTLAWKYWADVVEIRPRQVQARAEAKVWGTFSRIDGSNGTLAWSMLANDHPGPKEQRYDNGESWVVANPERPASGIDLVRVACHEIGHVLGLDHDSGNADALLRPSYSTAIPRPTERDYQRLVGLGYKRRTTPPLPPTPPYNPPDPPPVSGAVYLLPGGEYLTVDYPTKSITYPAGWSGSVK